MRLAFSVAILLLLAGNGAVAQMYTEFDAPRYAESIRLAHSYTGVGRGLAAVQHNPAALAFQSGFAGIFSSNTGALLFRYRFENIYNAAAAAHIEPWGMTLAASHSRVDFQSVQVAANTDTAYHPEVRWNSRLSTGHVAIRLLRTLSAGVSVLHYSAASTIYDSREGTISLRTEPAVDLGISLFGYQVGVLFPDTSDRFSYGINLQNALASKIRWEGWAGVESPYQFLRTGVAYVWNVPFGTVLRRNALRVMLASDMTLLGRNYDFTGLHYSAAVELTFAEFLMLSAGAEDEEQLTARKWGVPTTIRYGFGILLPVGEFVDLGQRLDLRFDYARSEFTLTDEFERDALRYTDPVAMSATLRWVP